MSDPRVLVLYPWPGLPSADRGAARRLLPLLQMLVRAGARVTVLSPGDPALAGERGGVDFEFWSPRGWERRLVGVCWRAYDSLFYRLTHGRTTARQRRQWWHYLSAVLALSLRRAVEVRAAAADLILLEYAFWSAILPRRRPPVILTFHDILSDMLPDGFMRRRVLARELSAAEGADAVVCVSRDDQERLRSFGIEAVLAPHAASQPPNDGTGSGEDDPLLDEIKSHRGRGGKVAFFIGSSLMPNVEAVRALERIGKLAGPEWLMVAAGSCCGPDERRENFLTLGSVSEQQLCSLYAACDAFVSPVASGTGASTKILEAMNRARPVLATRCSVRGYDLVAGREFLLCEKDEDFAHALGKIAHDPAMAGKLGDAGEKFAARYRPEKVYAPYLRMVRELAESRR